MPTLLRKNVERPAVAVRDYGCRAETLNEDNSTVEAVMSSEDAITVMAMKSARQRKVVDEVLLASGREVDHGGFARPIGLCDCCTPPGKPVIVEYDLEQAVLGRPDRALGIWSFADLLPLTSIRSRSSPSNRSRIRQSPTADRTPAPT